LVALRLRTVAQRITVIGNQPSADEKATTGVEPVYAALQAAA
jgi:hypothetical protein